MTNPNDLSDLLTKREYFAAKIMAGFAADPQLADNMPSDDGGFNYSEAAETAVKWADALIGALNDEASKCSESEPQPSNRSAA